MSKIRFTCKTCGSTEIEKDASAWWSEKAQEWVLSDVHDAAWCRNCDRETELKTEEIDE